MTSKPYAQATTSDELNSLKTTSRYSS
ncbi:hypothetical protein ACFW04_011487 [Cataglyphis niger]